MTSPLAQQSGPLTASIRADYLSRLPSPAKRRTIRERAGVSLAEMARELGVSHTLVLRWEQGACGFSHRTLGPYVELLESLAAIAPDSGTDDEAA